jgi:hypothetical protein
MCETFARAFLIPRHTVLEQATRCNISLASVERMAKVFQVTQNTMARRLLADLAVWPATLIICNEADHLFPRSKQVKFPGRVLRVIRRICPRVKGYFISLNKTVTQILPITEAYRKGVPVIEDVELHQFGEVDGRCRIDVRPLPSGCGVAALIVPESAPRKWQAAT